jgi:hypothetical protein
MTGQQLSHFRHKKVFFSLFQPIYYKSSRGFPHRQDREVLRWLYGLLRGFGYKNNREKEAIL